MSASYLVFPEQRKRCDELLLRIMRQRSTDNRKHIQYILNTTRTALRILLKVIVLLVLYYLGARVDLEIASRLARRLCKIQTLCSRQPNPKGTVLTTVESCRAYAHFLFSFTFCQMVTILDRRRYRERFRDPPLSSIAELSSTVMANEKRLERDGQSSCQQYCNR